MLRYLSIVIFSFSLILIGCGGSNRTGIGNASDNSIEGMPDWVLNIPQDANIHYEWGTGLSRDMGLATSAAAQDAQHKMSQFMDQRFKGLRESFKEDIKTGDDEMYLEQFDEATQSVTNTILVGVKTEKNEFRKEEGRYRVYVLSSMPFGAASEALVNELKKNKELNTRFQKAKLFDKLNEMTKD